MTWPNLLTAARLVAVPVIIWLIWTEHWLEAGIVFAIAALTDLADGYIAKTLNQETKLGSYLDPLADKALAVGVFVTLGLKGALPMALVFLVIGRDIAILSAVGTSKAIGHKLEIRPILISRLNTALQFALIAAVMTFKAIDFQAPAWVLAFALLVAATTLLSWAAYFILWVRALAEWSRERSR
ncbi:MAG: CDP-alcohol phosphatidyltransferase family protein [Alphaproteobacteria bacterium]|nr:CDP-alcohol phosphatidyltransferase family protein [Alphaproteobacteria bacterium]